MIKIAIVDDKSSNRNLVKDKLRTKPDWIVTLEAGNGAQFLDQLRILQPPQLPDVALMDVEMPGMNGIDAIRIASALHPGIKFIVLTVFDDDDKIFEAIKSGAAGYLLKDESQDVLQQSIEEMLEMTGSPMSPSIARKALKLLSRAHIPIPETPKAAVAIPLLTPREKEILSLQVEGLDYKEIGELLFISHNTVRTHICNIYEKLHVTSKAQAIQVAMKHGIV